jgi:hypothetical protein
MVLQGALSTRRVFLWSAVLALSLVLFVLGNLAAFNHNDFMYALAPAVWAQGGALYTEVPFPQAPLSILVNSLLVKAAGNVNFFLLGRIESMVFVLLAVLLPVLDRAKLRNFDIWALYVALCLTNLFVTADSGEIGNYSISLLCLAAAVTAFDRSGSAGWRGLVGCAAAGLATSAKLYFALLCPALLLYFLLKERAARDPVVIALCGIGFLVGFAPILYFLARDYQSFWRANVEIPVLFLPLKMASLHDGLLRIAKATLVFALLLSIPIGFLAAEALKQWQRGGSALLHEGAKHLVLVAAYIMAISPIFVYPQYFGPLAFLVLLWSAPWDSDALRPLYVKLGAVLSCAQCIQMTSQIYQGAHQDGDLVVAQVLKLQSKARQLVMSGYQCERKVYSAEPLFLLENGVKYPAELAAGPFLIFMRGEALERKGGAFDLDAHLQKWNPDIVLWGYYLDSGSPNEAATDRAIRDYARNHAFVVVPLGKMEGHAIELAYRPGCKRASLNSPNGKKP